MVSLVEGIQLSEKEIFPVFRNLWDFFAAKGNKTVFVSVGNSCSPLVELHFSETLGCKIHVINDKPEEVQKWEDIKEALKTRKVTEESSEFVKQAVKKWVLPQNVVPTLGNFTFANAKSMIGTICSSLEQPRIDVLKVNTDVSTMASTLYSLFHYGYRPGLLLLHWETSPDSTLETTLLAGHIQNIGYGLVSKFENNYLYMFTDKNVYEMCSWETLDAPNPLVAKLYESFLVKNQGKE
jgi:hypothetical protein